MNTAFSNDQVQSALRCISSNVSQGEKNKALQYLEHFQRSPEAWPICYQLLVTPNPAIVELQFFASQTIRNKVTYDLFQITDNLKHFKDSLLYLLTKHSQKLIVTQLSVSLARLAIQYTQWKNPIMEIINALNPFPNTLLTFLKILPEETLDLSFTPLSEDDFHSRVHELTQQIANDVLEFLSSCVDSWVEHNVNNNNNNNNNINTNNDKNIPSSQCPFSLSLILNCLNSWSYEIPIPQLLSVQPLISLIFQTLLSGADSNINTSSSTSTAASTITSTTTSINTSTDPDAFEAAVDCLCVILRESRDMHDDNSESFIIALFEQLTNLQITLIPFLNNITIDTTTSSDNLDDLIVDDDIMEGLTRIFVEAGEAWTVIISKNPILFQPLVITLLNLASRNMDLDVVAYTFPFWFQLKQNLVLSRYSESKEIFKPIYTQLIDSIIIRLQYPLTYFTSREEEDKFKEFRYSMGDVLKDCTAVVGTEIALTQPLSRIQNVIQSRKNDWQLIEAPLFSLRAMAQEISLFENNLVPQIIQIICNFPEHPKLRYATTLVLGRYTEWTSKHPLSLELQLDYIFNGFQSDSNSTSTQTTEILSASSHALMYFCSDCSKLLINYIDQLINFYINVQSSIDIESQFKLCQGLSAVINNQPIKDVPSKFQKLLDNNFNNLNLLVNKWETNPGLYSPKIADNIDLLFALLTEIKPRFQSPQEGACPLLPQIELIWNLTHSLLVEKGALRDQIIMDRVGKLIRRIFEHFHIFCEPFLGSVTEFLLQGYEKTGYGIYFWCSSSIIAIFGDDEAYPIPPNLRNQVWEFALSLTNIFIINFEKLNKSQLNDHSDLILDFFSFITDLTMFYPKEVIMTPDLLGHLLNIALTAVTEVKSYDSYISILRWLDDILSWGFKTPPISTVALDIVPDEWRDQIVNQVLITRAFPFTFAMFNGLVSNFEISAHSDAINCIVRSFRLATEINNNDSTVCGQLITQCLEKLGHVTEGERSNLCEAVTIGLTQHDYRKVREGLRMFIEWYLRKNVNSRLE